MKIIPKDMESIIGVALLILIIFVYFSPSVIARGKRNWEAIFVLNLFAGWTFVGWVIALVWACTKDNLPPKNQHN